MLFGMQLALKLWLNMHLKVVKQEDINHEIKRDNYANLALENLGTKLFGGSNQYIIFWEFF